jgi:erythronate-4-phosphate dehydrogenase
MRILADRNMLSVDAIFAALGRVELVDGRNISRAQLEGVEVLLVRSVTRLDEALLGDTQPSFVGTATSGIDHVDRDFLQRRGIPFAWAAGSNADSVVDYVLSAISHCDDKLERILAGAAVGIIGFGHIGRRLCARLQALGVDVRAYDPWLQADEFPELCSLEQVLSCEVITVHAELTHRQPWPSYHLLAGPELQQLDQGALLINAGRGELIDSQALLSIAAARPDLQLVLDVWEGEPRVDSRLLQGCRFATAHIAGYSYDGKVRATQMLYRACLEALGRAVNETPMALPTESVTVPRALSGAALIRWLLTQVYDIREDDGLLRAAMPDGFDQLRREYRRRRELGSLNIANLEQLNAAAKRLCLALSCQPGVA